MKVFAGLGDKTGTIITWINISFQKIGYRLLDSYKV